MAQAKGTKKATSPEIGDIQHYQILDFVAEGTFGTVWKAQDLEKNQVVAIKTVEKNDKNIDGLRNEVKALKAMDHPNIIKLKDVIETNNSMHFVEEFANGGSLIDVLEKQQRPFCEKQAKEYFRQIVQAVLYSHQRGFAHRDIKLENVMLHDNKIKLIDFGLCFPLKGALCSKYGGSLRYSPPEVVTHVPFNPRRADVWSLGVLLFVMLNKEHPFSRDRLGTNIVNVYMQPFTADVSDQAKDLVMKMLKKEPEDRISLEEILRHPWLKKKSSFRKLWCWG